MKLRRLEACPQLREKLIAVDGPDGVGKDTLAKLLAEELRVKTGEEVITATPNLFEGCERAERLGLVFERLGGYRLPQERVNKFYLATFNRLREDVVRPALERGSWVVEASSDIRPVAFTLAERTPEIATYTQGVMRSGIVTRDLIPQHRVLLAANSSDLHDRIKARGENSDDDPDSVGGCDSRRLAYDRAVQFVKNELTGDLGDQVRWREERIDSVSPDEIGVYMKEKAQKLSDWILE